MSVDNKAPEIRFEGFSGEWVENYLGELIDIRSAARVHKEQWTEAGVPFFRTSDVVSIYKGQENTKVYISQEVYNSLSEKIGKVTKDDLLITGGGSIGIPYLVPNDNPLYFKDADLLWLKNNKRFDGYFLYTFFFSEPFKKHIKSISHTGTIAHYTIEQAKATPINTCYEEEQTQIGNYFQKLDELINQHQQKHDKLSNIKKAMLEKMFPKPGVKIPEIRFKGFSGEWHEVVLSSVIDVRSGKDYKKLGTGNIPVYGTGGYMLSVDSALSDNENAIGIGRKGTIDKPYILHAPFWTVDTLFYAVPFSNFNLKFVFCLFQKIDWKRHNESTGVPSLSRAAINNVPVYVTNESEQIKIGNYFQKLDTLINQHQQQITKLNNIKQAFLSKMFV
ncbi:restriction endonuclease subunit S [Salmonella enterica subsp. enterica]|nr:restriction endonuclease subunit S [Salmonella enterica subsp. enterica]